MYAKIALKKKKNLHPIEHKIRTKKKGKRFMTVSPFFVPSADKLANDASYSDPKMTLQNLRFPTLSKISPCGVTTI